MPAVMLDTDILSLVLTQRDAVVTARAAQYLATQSGFTFSAFTCYEVRRGFLRKRAVGQLRRFDLFCQQCRVLSVSESVLDRAAELWAASRQRGLAGGDADLLIAATALEYGLPLVTGNLRHFSWISTLSLIDLRTP